MYSQACATGSGPFFLTSLARSVPLDVLHDQQVRAADLVGVVGADDVRMGQRRRRPNLALEAAHGVGVVEPFLADELEGDDPAELPVAGLEDLAHAALAQPLQQDVRAQEKILASPLEELVGLVGSEPASLDQLPGERFRVGEAGLEGLQTSSSCAGSSSRYWRRASTREAVEAMAMQATWAERVGVRFTFTSDVTSAVQVRPAKSGGFFGPLPAVLALKSMPQGTFGVRFLSLPVGGIAPLSAFPAVTGNPSGRAQQAGNALPKATDRTTNRFPLSHPGRCEEQEGEQARNLEGSNESKRCGQQRGE